MFPDILRQKTKRIITAALIFWLSGVVVLFCCQMPANVANDEIESCPLAKKGNCAKTFVKDAREFVGQVPLAFDCCDFPAKIFDKARKLENVPQPLLITKAIEIVAPRFLAFRQNFQALTFHQSFVRNRGSTYLRNLVFRI